jgi:3-deoxy-D-manno-octulosonic-acid transferase
MSILYGTYKLLTKGLIPTLFPAFWIYSHITGRYKKHFKERLGFLPVKLLRARRGAPRIWIHAASLGEVRVAASIVEALAATVPNAFIVLSTMTEQGREMAEETFGEKIPVFYAPIDIPCSVRRALSAVRPDVMVFLETEIWPAWVFEAHRRGIKTALINGRISLRSIGRYLKLRPFFCDVLKNIDVFSMIMEPDAERIKAMGADPKKIEVNGNAKYEILASITDPALERELRQSLNIGPSHRVFVAGSTRTGEEELVLDAYQAILKEFPDTLLIVAPRHIERAFQIGTLVQRRGLRFQLRTDLAKEETKRTAPVVILNTFGELFKVYSVASIVFCGASLVPLGGQNPLEPAVWGKPVFYGPYMENFLDAKALLEDVGGGVPVSNPGMLAQKAIWFLNHREALKCMGEKGRQAALNSRGSAKRHAQVVARLLGLTESA